jgi:hypothetical protein
MLAIGFTFAVSLRRYFPGTRVTSSVPLFLAASFGLMTPMYAVGRITTNKEVIEELGHLDPKIEEKLKYLKV